MDTQSFGIRFVEVRAFARSGKRIVYVHNILTNSFGIESFMCFQVSGTDKRGMVATLLDSKQADGSVTTGQVNQHTTQ